MAGGTAGESSTAAVSDAIIDLDDAAPTPGRDRREAIVLAFAVCVALSSALFGRDGGVSIERTPPADASRFASANDGRVVIPGPFQPVEDSGDITKPSLVPTSPRGVLDLVTHVYDSTGHVELWVLDRNGQLIHAPDRGSVR